MRQNELNIWINALKGGEYNQVKNALKTDNGYCCLGVLCEVLKDKYDLKWSRSSPYRINYGGLSSEETLPPTFREKVGISNVVMSVLMDKNDHGVSFEEIADYIEENKHKLLEE